MVDDRAALEPRPGMIISVLTRQDVVVMDPGRFMGAARRAFRAENPEVSEAEAGAHVGDVYDAVNALMDRYGSIASDPADRAAGATPRRRMHGRFGLLPGDRVSDRPDGLSPAGEMSLILLDEPMPLQDYGCFMTRSNDEIFGALARRAD